MEQARTIDLNHLKFLRKLSQEGKLEHKPMSAPRGDYAFWLPHQELMNYLSVELKAKRRAFGERKGEALLRHIAMWGDY